MVDYPRTVEVTVRSPEGDVVYRLNDKDVTAIAEAARGTFPHMVGPGARALLERHYDQLTPNGRKVARILGYDVPEPTVP